MILTAEDMLRHGPETEREKILFSFVEDLESKVMSLKEDARHFEEYECPRCEDVDAEIEELESRINSLKQLLDKHGIEYE